MASTPRLEAPTRSLETNLGQAPRRRYTFAPDFGLALVATIYKICERAQWLAAQAAGAFGGSAVDKRDGFIHFSTASQLAETASKHFARQSDLMLIAIDAQMLGERLKWESSRGGDLFPHLYAALPLTAVRWASPLPEEVEGRRPLPELEP